MPARLPSWGGASSGPGAIATARANFDEARLKVDSLNRELNSLNEKIIKMGGNVSEEDKKKKKAYEAKAKELTVIISLEENIKEFRYSKYTEIVGKIGVLNKNVIDNLRHTKDGSACYRLAFLNRCAYPKDISVTGAKVRAPLGARLTFD
jgi:hypothetical protein